MNCIGCGCEFEGRKRKFCTKHCRWRSEDRAKGIPTKAEYLASIINKAHCFTCESCGKECHRRPGGNSTVNRFCSHACRKAQTEAKRTAAKVARAKEREELRHVRAIAKIQKVVSKAPRLCACGAVLQYRHRLCEVCAKARKKELTKAYRKTEAHKALRKAHKTKRRAKENATIDKVKPSDVFGRDKWKCQLCGCKTPKALRGTYEDNAPELDHVISLAEGGDHTYGNLQCACRRCNISKGSKSRGQLGLELH